MGDKTRAKVEQGSGKAKEAVGELQGDEGLRKEGQREQVKGDLREAGGKLKDAARDAKDKAGDAAGHARDH
ncbi:MAG TPA: CsbD family protein [Gaiellales bacterium]|jgi:uncharacterized protein YjbJ (UPF0337 family)|nr:CsbD family protein [Gaiellales bacterium]